MTDTWSRKWRTTIDRLTDHAMNDPDPERQRRAKQALNLVLRPAPKHHKRFNITKEGGA